MSFLSCEFYQYFGNLKINFQLKDSKTKKIIYRRNGCYICAVFTFILTYKKLKFSQCFH